MKQSVVTTFLSAAPKGLARSTLYRTEFRLPAGVSSAKAEDLVNPKCIDTNIQAFQSNTINVLCQSVSIAMSSKMTYEMKQNTAPIKRPFTGVFDPITISFYVDAEYLLKEYIDIWNECAYNIRTNTFNFPAEYESDMTVFALNDNREDVYSVTYRKAWPLNVGMIEYSYSSANTAIILPVTFAYTRAEPTRM